MNWFLLASFVLIAVAVGTGVVVWNRDVTPPGTYTGQLLTAVCRAEYENLVFTTRVFGELDYYCNSWNIGVLASEYARDNAWVRLNRHQMSVLIRRILWYNRRIWTANTRDCEYSPPEEFLQYSSMMNSELPEISFDYAEELTKDIFRETLIPKHLWRPGELEARLPLGRADACERTEK